MTATRVEPLPRDAWGPEVDDALRAAFVPDVAERFLSTGPDALAVPDAISTMLHHPALAKTWLTFNNVLLWSPALDGRQRELMVLRVAWRTRSNYEWLQHVRLAPRFDITDAEIHAIAGQRDDVQFSSFESALLAATDELLDDYRVDDATWAQLAEHLDPRQLVELVFVVGAYTCLAMAFKSFGLHLDADGANDTMPLPES